MTAPALTAERCAAMRERAEAAKDAVLFEPSKTRRVVYAASADVLTLLAALEAAEARAALLERVAEAAGELDRALSGTCINLRCGNDGTHAPDCLIGALHAALAAAAEARR